MEHSFSLFSDIKRNRFSDQEKYISFIFISENNILMSRNQIYDLKKNCFHIKKLEFEIFIPINRYFIYIDNNFFVV